MSKQAITTTPEIVSLQEAFKKAKKAKDDWAKYQREVEGTILKKLEEELGVALPETGSVELEQLKISFGQTRKWDDTELAELAAVNPHLVGSTLRVKYEPAIGKIAVDKIVKNNGELGSALAGCFEDAPKKPGFTLR